MCAHHEPPNNRENNALAYDFEVTFDPCRAGRPLDTVDWCILYHTLLKGEKTRQDILNEIIAKSKERKLEKARGKEEQESERERLDEGMEELLGMLHQRPSKSERGTTKGQSDDYDLAIRVRRTQAQGAFSGIVSRFGWMAENDLYQHMTALCPVFVAIVARRCVYSHTAFSVDSLR